MRRKQRQPRRRLGENDGDIAAVAVKVERGPPPGTLLFVRNSKPPPGAWLDLVPVSANDPDWFGLGVLHLSEDPKLESADQTELQLRRQAALGDEEKPLARWSLRWVASTTSFHEAKPSLSTRKRKAPDSQTREDGVLTVQVKAPLAEALWRLAQKRVATLVFIRVPVSGWLVLLDHECCLSTSLRQESARRDLQRLISFWHPEAAFTEAPLREGETPNSSSWSSLWRFRSARGLVQVPPGPQHTDQRVAWGDASWVYEIMRRLPADSSTCQGSELETETSALVLGREPAVEFEVRPEVPGLRPHLRPYQCRAVSWMLQRERLGIAFEYLPPLSIPDWRGESFSPLLYEPFESVATTTSSREQSCSSLPLLHGGMLCDEMGLGKTVELLACMLLQRQERAEQASPLMNGIESTDLNRFRQTKRTCFECGARSTTPRLHCLLVGRARKRYFCDDCVEKMRTGSYQPSRATLIVCPTVILGQWELEIRKHLLDSSVDVVVYRGLRRETYQRCQRLASADIVLTTYDALRADVNRAQDQILQERNLRYAKRYQVAPTPLSRIEWERVCLDEAQMIHGGVAAAAAMALKLRAHKRWCITGTPVRRSVDDLEGLVRFLRFEPFDEPDRWRKWLIRPCERNGVGASARLAQVIRALSWRSEKVDVQREIGLLPQFEVMQTLSLGPVERHYYMRQHETCASFVRHLLNSRVAKHLEQPGSLVKTASRRGYGLVRLVLHHLKVLRQACCHPRLAPASAGGGGLEPNIMTMDQVLDVLVQRARLECEEAQRSLVAALNGLAAIALLRGQAADAVELYRTVLRCAQDPKQTDFIEIDPLQRYHVMVNLAEVLQTHHLERSGLGMTLREARLLDDAADLRRAYLRESRELVETARSQLLQLGEELERRAQSRAGRLWWVTALEAIAAAGLERWLLDRLEEDGIPQQLGATTPVSSIKTLIYVLVQVYDSLEQARRALLSRLVMLPGNGTSEPTEIQIRNSGNCGQCRQDMHGEPCEHCRSEELFEAYERLLFAVRTRLVNATQTREQNSGERMRRLAAVITEGDGGVRLASELERTLRFIGTALRRVEDHAPLLNDAAMAEWERFALLKREFTQAHAYFRAQKDYLGALDELVMAATRITIRKPEENVSESERRYRILESEIEPTALSLEMDRRLAEEQLRRKKGQLVYLQHLKSACIEDLAAKSRESCPICYRALGAELVLLPCGHCFCIECISSYLEARVYRQHSRLLPCPVCREVCNARELSFIQTTASSPCIGSEPIKGSYGAKIEAVVRDLLLLQEFATRQAAEFGNHPSTSHRCVVFSQWSELLQILSTALERNSIPHIIGDIEAFRQRTDPFCALLLPIRTGANGLNLTEARHVLLLEPLLDPAAELQAIGRVHRIGQSCSTFVHRYVVQGTVEEHVQAIGARNQWREQHLRSAGQARSQTRADMVDTQHLTLNDLRRMFDLDSDLS